MSPQQLDELRLALGQDPVGADNGFISHKANI